MLVLSYLRLAWHLCRGAVVCAVLFPLLDEAGRREQVRRWSRQLLAICGIRVAFAGRTDIDPAGTMLIANHVSWLDIFAIHAWRAVRFVAKSEIRGWPLIGWLCERTGTLFIERERRRAVHHMLHAIAGQIAAGDAVCVFPEGTTSDGTGLLPFHANLLQVPVAAGAPVLPLALRYTDARSGAPTTAPAFVGDMTLIACLHAVLRARPLVCTVHVGEPIVTARGESRRELALRAEAQVRGLLGFSPRNDDA